MAIYMHKRSGLALEESELSFNLGSHDPFSEPISRFGTINGINKGRLVAKASFSQVIDGNLGLLHTH